MFEKPPVFSYNGMVTIKIERVRGECMTNKLAADFNFRSLMKFVMPSMIMMVFLSLYTIVDGIFISRFVGTVALSATNIVYPVISFELGIGIMLATGTAALVSIKMGEGKEDEANENFTFIIVVSLVAGICFAVFGNLFIDQIVEFLGATKEQFPQAKIYISVLLYFAPSLLLQIYFQYMMSVAGRPNLGLWLTIIAGILNVVLDYIFMKPMGMGIYGAALATGIGYFSTAIVGIVFFAVKKKGLRLVKVRADWKMLLKAVTNGSSEMVSNLATSITTFLFNISIIGFYGNNGVAAITIVFYFQFLFSSIFIGYTAGVAPIISYKYGEKNYSQLKHVVKMSIIFIATGSIMMFAVSRMTIGSILHVFAAGNQSVYNIAKSGFNLFSYSFLFTGFSIMASAMFTALSNGRVSAVISFARTFGFIVISILVLPRIMGGNGLWITIPVAEFLSLILSGYFYKSLKEEYGY